MLQRKPDVQTVNKVQLIHKQHLMTGWVAMGAKNKLALRKSTGTSSPARLPPANKVGWVQWHLAGINTADTGTTAC